MSNKSKSKFQTLATTQLETTAGGYYDRWYANRGPWAAERYYAREERFAGYGPGPYGYARFERRYGW